MKRAYSVALVVLLALAGLLAGCSMPDYQLDFSYVDVTNINVNTVTVYYRFENQGTKDIKNVTADITVYSADNSATASTTVSIGNIASGSSTYGNAYVSMPSTHTYAIR